MIPRSVRVSEAPSYGQSVVAYDVNSTGSLSYLEAAAEIAALAAEIEGLEKGFFVEPTVLADVTNDMAVAVEEIFGPVVVVIPFDDEDHGVAIANDSPFGLAASVWSKDASRGEAVARRIEAGAVCVNDAQINYLVLELPMGGWKTSGMGQRHGAPGIRKYCRQQSLLVTRLAPKRDLHMFPYKARTTGMLLKGVKLLYGRGKRD